MNDLTLKIVGILLALMFTAMGGLAAWHVQHILTPSHVGAAAQFVSIDRTLEKLLARQVQIGAQLEDVKGRLIAQEILLRNLESLEQLVSSLEKQARKQAKHHDPELTKLIRTVPGIGEIISLTLLYEAHTIERFKTHQKFSSYCRVVKCGKESNGKKAGRGGSKIGNPHLRWALGEAAIYASQFSPEIHIFYG